MKRFLVLLGADIRFQFRYGFYAVYLIVSALYIIAVRLLPESVRPAARAVVVFSDPAALGLFFMGAILLYEKSDRVFHPWQFRRSVPWNTSWPKRYPWPWSPSLRAFLCSSVRAAR